MAISKHMIHTLVDGQALVVITTAEAQWARIRMNRMKQGPLRYGVQPLVKICKPVSYLGLMPFNSIWKKKPLTKFWRLADQSVVSASL